MINSLSKLFVFMFIFPAFIFLARNFYDTFFFVLVSISLFFLSYLSGITFIAKVRKKEEWFLLLCIMEAIVFLAFFLFLKVQTFLLLPIFLFSLFFTGFAEGVKTITEENNSSFGSILLMLLVVASAFIQPFYSRDYFLYGAILSFASFLSSLVSRGIIREKKVSFSPHTKGELLLFTMIPMTILSNLRGFLTFLSDENAYILTFAILQLVLYTGKKIPLREENREIVASLFIIPLLLLVYLVTNHFIALIFLFFLAGIIEKFGDIALGRGFSAAMEKEFYIGVAGFFASAISSLLSFLSPKLLLALLATLSFFFSIIFLQAFRRTPQGT